jgi:hypothetical protein
MGSNPEGSSPRYNKGDELFIAAVGGLALDTIVEGNGVALSLPLEALVFAGGAVITTSVIGWLKHRQSGQQG